MRALVPSFALACLLTLAAVTTPVEAYSVDVWISRAPRPLALGQHRSALDLEAVRRGAICARYVAAMGLLGRPLSTCIARELQPLDLCSAWTTAVAEVAGNLDAFWELRGASQSVRLRLRPGPSTACEDARDTDDR